MPGSGVAAAAAQRDGGSGRASVRVRAAPWLYAHLVMRSTRSLNALCVRRCWRPTRPGDATGTGARDGALAGGGHTRAASSTAVVALTRGSGAPPRRRRRRTVAAARQQRHLRDQSKRDRVSEGPRGCRPGVAWRQMQRRPRGIMAVSKHAGTIRPLGAYLTGGASAAALEVGDGADGDGNEAGEVGGRAAAFGAALEPHSGT